MLAALLLVCNELVVGFQASRVAASVLTRDLDGMDERVDRRTHASRTAAICVSASSDWKSTLTTRVRRCPNR